MKAVLVSPQSAARLLHDRLTTQVSRVENWSRVGEVAQALIDRSYSGKAVLTIDQ